MHKKNIFEINSNKIESIFKDEYVFYPNYYPKDIKAREKETEEISFSLRPLLENKRTRNLIIHGPPGTGKTLISNYVLKQLMEHTQKANYLYINAIEDNSRFAFYSKILNNLFSVALPRRGLGIDELLTRLKEEMSKTTKHPILIIDEVDKLQKEDVSLILYDLSRFEINNKYFTLILITNHKDFLAELEPRTQSSLFLNDLEFKKYTPASLKEILKERIDFGLIEDSISLDLVGYITGYAAKNGGDARIAIDLLYKSAKLAEKKGSLEITREMILESVSLIDAVKLLEKLNYTTPIQKKILRQVPKEGIETGKLYKFFEKTESDRTIRRHLTFLETIGLIKTTEIREKGNKRLVNTTFDLELLK